MLSFGAQLDIPLQIEIPNCNDPVFRGWCKICELEPGQRYDVRDYRIAELQALMQHYGFTAYDPESDRDDDYLTRGL